MRNQQGAGQPAQLAKDTTSQTQTSSAHTYPMLRTKLWLHSGASRRAHSDDLGACGVSCSSTRQIIPSTELCFAMLRGQHADPHCGWCWVLELSVCACGAPYQSVTLDRGGELYRTVTQVLCSQHTPLTPALVIHYFACCIPVKGCLLFTRSAPAASDHCSNRKISLDSPN